jgi:hypothetical protein
VLGTVMVMVPINVVVMMMAMLGVLSVMAVSSVVMRVNVYEDVRVGTRRRGKRHADRRPDGKRQRRRPREG